MKEDLPLKKVALDAVGLESSMVNTLRRLMSAELVAVSFYASAGAGRGVTEEDAEFFREHAEEEQVHYNDLADRLAEIQGMPVYHMDEMVQLASPDVQATRTMQSDDLVELARVSSELEILAIQNYKQAIQQARQQEDEASVALLQQILREEEEHLADFQAIMEKETGTPGPPVPASIPTNLGQIGE